ncbi:hypothetical protein VP01_1345g1 [Puccinia sorghi]|uniref:Uncharacterized protein n=1 Tax=Puccinia sorghi TaxID=27349 RepID=A0A0L6VMA4_9BASI|nr:hypothetical protein VP01_1345g1 [Puccinia sorghi]
MLSHPNQANPIRMLQCHIPSCERGFIPLFLIFPPGGNFVRIFGLYKLVGHFIIYELISKGLKFDFSLNLCNFLQIFHVILTEVLISNFLIFFSFFLIQIGPRLAELCRLEYDGLMVVDCHCGFRNILEDFNLIKNQNQETGNLIWYDHKFYHKPEKPPLPLSLCFTTSSFCLQCTFPLISLYSTFVLSDKRFLCICNLSHRMIFPSVVGHQSDTLPISSNVPAPPPTATTTSQSNPPPLTPSPFASGQFWKEKTTLLHKRADDQDQTEAEKKQVEKAASRAVLNGRTCCRSTYSSAAMDSQSDLTPDSTPPFIQSTHENIFTTSKIRPLLCNLFQQMHQKEVESCQRIWKNKWVSEPIGPITKKFLEKYLSEFVLATFFELTNPNSLYNVNNPINTPDNEEWNLLKIKSFEFHLSLISSSHFFPFKYYRPQYSTCFLYSIYANSWTPFCAGCDLPHAILAAEKTICLLHRASPESHQCNLGGCHTISISSPTSWSLSHPGAIPLSVVNQEMPSSGTTMPAQTMTMRAQTSTSSAQSLPGLIFMDSEEPQLFKFPNHTIHMPTKIPLAREVLHWRNLIRANPQLQLPIDFREIG